MIMMQLYPKNSSCTYTRVYHNNKRLMIIISPQKTLQ